MMRYRKESDMINIYISLLPIVVVFVIISILLLDNISITTKIGLIFPYVISIALTFYSCHYYYNMTFISEYVTLWDMIFKMLLCSFMSLMTLIISSQTSNRHFNLLFIHSIISMTLMLNIIMIWVTLIHHILN